MSSAKRCEPFSGPTNGPFYSRYTEHKVVFNFHAPTPPSPHRPLSADSHSSSPLTLKNNDTQSLRLTAKELGSPSSQRKLCEQRSYSAGESPLDFSFSVSRNNSSDGLYSSYSNSPTEFRAISPKPLLYDSPLSVFRSGSIDSSCISSPRSGSSIDSAKDRRFAFSEKNSVINNQKPRSKFANAVNKHCVSIFAAAAFKGAHEKLRTKKLTVSCPELVQERKSPTPPVKVNNSVSALDSIAKKEFDQQSKSKNLKVPDIFTTSFTHSPSTETRPTLQKSSLSLQEFPTSLKNSDKNNLQRALSLTKTNPDDLKIGCLISPNMYRDDQISQITEYMFVGSIEAAYNERRLCRLDIESLVDISNLNEMQVPAQKKLVCPCLCQIEFKHFRSRLIIAVPDEENDGIDQYFEEVNKFIEGARRCSKKVLIYSYEGKSRAALFAVQYLMSYEGLLLRQAYNMVKKQRPQVSLNPSFQKALEKLEKTLFPDEKHSVNICNEYLNVADPQAIKCAWIDC